MSIALAFSAAGAGKPLLLLQGFPLTDRMWDGVLPRLAKTRFVVAPALRGFGLSPVAPTASMDEMAGDVFALMDRLNFRSAAVCGLSMGGYVAFAMLRLAPERVDALVLADTRSQADTGEQKAGRAALAQKVMVEGTAAAVDAFLPKLLPADTPAALRDRVRAMCLENTKEGVAAALHGLAGRADAGPLLAGIRVPTLALCGAKDGVSPPAEMREMTSRIPGARFVEIPGCGHLTAIERPAEFAGAMENFLG